MTVDVSAAPVWRTLRTDRTSGVDDWSRADSGFLSNAHYGRQRQQASRSDDVSLRDLLDLRRAAPVLARAESSPVVDTVRTRLIFHTGSRRPAHIGSLRSPRSTRRPRKGSSLEARSTTTSVPTRSVRSRTTAPPTVPATSRTPSARSSASPCRSTSGARTASRSSRPSRKRSTRRASSSARSAWASRGPSATSECGQLKPVAGPRDQEQAHKHDSPLPRRPAPILPRFKKHRKLYGKHG